MEADIKKYQGKLRATKTKALVLGVDTESYRNNVVLGRLYSKVIKHLNEINEIENT